MHRLHLNHERKNYFGLVPSKTLPLSTTTTRAVLSACRESRAEARYELPDLLMIGNHLLRYNRDRDIISLVDLNLREVADLATLVYVCLPWIEYRLPCLLWTQQVKNVALESFEIGETDDAMTMLWYLEYRDPIIRAPRGIKILERFIGQLRSMESFFMVAIASCPYDDIQKNVRRSLCRQPLKKTNTGNIRTNLAQRTGRKSKAVSSTSCTHRRYASTRPEPNGSEVKTGFVTGIMCCLIVQLGHSAWRLLLTTRAQYLARHFSRNICPPCQRKNPSQTAWQE